jgi:ribosomal protein S18 acetylase RimI-like enzyme
LVAIDLENSPPQALWTKEDFLMELAEQGTACYVAEIAGAVVGYCIYAIEQKRFHLVRLSVSKTYQRQGIGSGLVGRLIKKTESHKERKTITMSVRERDLGTQMLLKGLNFKWFKTISQGYEDTCEDSYLFKFSISH